MQNQFNYVDIGEKIRTQQPDGHWVLFYRYI